MNELWIASVNYFVNVKHESDFKFTDKQKDEDDDMFLYNSDDLDDFLGIDADDDDLDANEWSYLDDEDPDFLEIYDDDLYNISFVWSFYAYCLIFFFDFTGVFFIAVFPIIICHYLMYEPDLFEEEDTEPTEVMLSNIYETDMALAYYQYENFPANDLNIKNYDFLYYINVNKFNLYYDFFLNI